MMLQRSMALEGSSWTRGLPLAMPGADTAAAQSRGMKEDCNQGDALFRRKAEPSSVPTQL
jgi:hypothetical protein